MAKLVHKPTGSLHHLFLELKFDSSKAEEKHFMKLPRICLHFKPITLLSIPLSHCLLPNIPQRLVGIFQLFVKAGCRKTCRLAPRIKPLLCRSTRGIWSFSDTKAGRRGHPGQEACKRGLVSTSHYVGAVSESRDSVEPIIQSWDWDYGGVRLF